MIENGKISGTTPARLRRITLDSQPIGDAAAQTIADCHDPHRGNPYMNAKRQSPKACKENGIL